MSLLDTYYKLQALKQQQQQAQMQELQTAFQMANFMQKMKEMQRGEALRTDLANVSPYDTFSRPSMALPGNEDVPDPNSMVESQVRLSTPQLNERYSDVLWKYDPAGEITRRQAREDKDYERSKDPIISMPGLPMPMAASVAGTFAKNTQQDDTSLIAKPGKDYTPESLAAYQKTRDPSVLKPVEEKRPKPKAGYRYNEQGEQEMIPGGPEDTKFQIKYAADEGKIRNITDGLARFKTQAIALRDHEGLGGITGIKGAFPNIPGSKAANAEALLEQIKSKASLEVMTMFRQLSPTGGLVGNQSDKEGQRFEDYLGALKKAQDLPAMKKAMNDIISWTDDATKNMTTTFDQTYSNKLHENYGRRQGDVKAEDAMAELRRRGVIK